MTAENFPVKHSILYECAVGDWILTRYALKKPVSSKFFRRSISDVYLINTRNAAYFLKVYMQDRHSRSNIEAEISFLNTLLDHDIAVAAPIANKDGAYINAINAPEGTRYAVLFEAIEGDEPQEVNLEHSRRFGQLAGSLHNCADSLTHHYDRRHLDEKVLIKEPLEYIKLYVQHRKSDFEYLKAFGNDLIGELRSLVSKEKPEYGMCHGDFHTGNARFDKNGRLTLFDFDSCGYGWRAIDIGVYHVSYDWLDLSIKTRRSKDRFWEAFVVAYNTERTLSRNELLAAQLCLPIRHLELMGITLRYWSSQIGVGWIDDEYFDRHLKWFRKWAEECTKK